MEKLNTYFKKLNSHTKVNIISPAIFIVKKIRDREKSPSPSPSPKTSPCTYSLVSKYKEQKKKITLRDLAPLLLLVFFPSFVLFFLRFCNVGKIFDKWVWVPI